MCSRFPISYLICLAGVLLAGATEDRTPRFPPSNRAARRHRFGARSRRRPQSWSRRSAGRRVPTTTPKR
jgi:hypothetical protein